MTAAVIEVLTKYDLAGIQPGRSDGFPLDEYSAEARPIASFLLNSGRVQQSDVSSVWARWFGDDLAHLSGSTWVALLADLNAIGSIAGPSRAEQP